MATKSHEVTHVSKRMFTDKQILKVVAKLKENPSLIPQMLESAKAGDHDDIQFLLEAAILGYSLRSDNPKTGVVFLNPKYKPKISSVT